MKNIIKIIYSEDSKGVKTVLDWEFRPLSNVPSDVDKDLLDMGRKISHRKPDLSLEEVIETKKVEKKEVKKRFIDVDTGEEVENPEKYEGEVEEEKYLETTEEDIEELVGYKTSTGKEVKVFYATETFDDQLLGKGIESITLDDSDQGYSYELNTEGQDFKGEEDLEKTYEIYRELAILKATKSELETAELDTTYVDTLISEEEAKLP